MSSLFLCAGTAYIQATLGFIDAPTDTLQRCAAARAADIESVSGTAVLGVEPEVVRDHLLKPHPAPGFGCVTVGRGDHCHFLFTLGIAVDEWVVADLDHVLHCLSVSVQKTAPAICQRFCFRSEAHGGKSVLHFPEIHLLVTGHRHWHTTPVLEDDVAVIVTLVKILGTEVFVPRLYAVEELVSHFFCSFRRFWVYGSQGATQS